MLDMGIIKVEVNFPELKEAIIEIEHGRSVLSEQGCPVRARSTQLVS